MLKNKLKKLILVLIVTVFLMGLAPSSIAAPQTNTSPPARQAGTVVKCEGCDITVSVYLAFAFLDDSAWLNAKHYIYKWTKGMLEIWNEPDFTYGICECPVHFEIIVDVLPQGEKCPDPANLQKEIPGWHCVQVVTGRERNPHTGWEPVNERGNTADATPLRGNDGNGYGEWTTWTSGLDAAHELGHFMGLEDEYHYADTDGDGRGDTYVNDNPQPADGPQSIMAQTWGKVTVLQAHIDKIIEDAGVECPLPECCCGNKEHEDYFGEECDYTATPSGCPAGQVCSTTCKCVAQPKVTPRCGDGYISRPPDGKEECDPKAKPTGCQADEECINCKCVKPSEEETPPPEEETPTPTPVCGDGIIIPPEECDPAATPKGCGENQECLNCKCLTPTEPSLSVTPELLDFGTKDTGKFLIISNSGGGTLSWEISPPLPEWIGILPVGGEVAAGEEFSVLVNVGREGLAPGIYKHELSINSNGGEKVIFIQMSVEEEL